MSGFLILQAPSHLPCRAELKPIKHPNILLNTGGLCHAAAPCNASWVIMVITQPSEARPEALGWRGQIREPGTRRAAVVEGMLLGGQGEAGTARCHINTHCHIREHWLFVDAPSDPSASTTKTLMRDDDKCVSSLGFAWPWLKELDTE